jgi:hypothetical protein
VQGPRLWRREAGNGDRVNFAQLIGRNSPLRSRPLKRSTALLRPRRFAVVPRRFEIMRLIAAAHVETMLRGIPGFGSILAS